MKKAVEKLLVAIKERVQLMWEGKHHMKVWGVNDLGPALIHPEFLQDSLTVGTVAVAAGIVMEFEMAAVGTLRNVSAEFAGLAQEDGPGGFLLNPGQDMALCGNIIIRELKYLLDVVITHDKYLPCGQRG